MQNFAPAAPLPTSCELRLTLRYVGIPKCKLYLGKEKDRSVTKEVQVVSMVPWFQSVKCRACGAAASVQRPAHPAESARAVLSA